MVKDNFGMCNGYSLPAPACCWMMSNGQMNVTKKATLTKSMNPVLYLLALKWNDLPVATCLFAAFREELFIYNRLQQGSFVSSGLYYYISTGHMYA